MNIIPIHSNMYTNTHTHTNIYKVRMRRNPHHSWVAHIFTMISTTANGYSLSLNLDSHEVLPLKWLISVSCSWVRCSSSWFLHWDSTSASLVWASSSSSSRSLCSEERELRWSSVEGSAPVACALRVPNLACEKERKKASSQREHASKLRKDLCILMRKNMPASKHMTMNSAIWRQQML